MTKISIVCAYNTQVAMTKEFLDTMMRTTKEDKLTIECVLVHGWINIEDVIKNKINHPFITKLITIKNIGFCNTLNFGLKAVSKDTDYVFFVGNDSFPKDNGWLTILVNDLKEYPDLVLVNPIDQTTHITRPQYTKGRVLCNFYPSIAWLFKRELLDTVGLLDEDFYGSGYYADNDYCQRITNYYGENKILVNPKVVLEHRISVEGKSMNITNQMSELKGVYDKKWN